MREKTKGLFVIGAIVALLAASAAVVSAESLSSQNFVFKASCPFSNQFPSYSGGNFTLPYPGENPLCPVNFIDAYETSPQAQSGFSFHGSFVIKRNAPSDSDEMAVFGSDNIATWNGQTYGFRASLYTKGIYGFFSDGSQKHTVFLVQDDNKPHNFSVTASYSSGIDTFNFYVDGLLKGTLTYQSAMNFPKQQYWMVMTTHRYSMGWPSGYSYMKASDIEVYDWTSDTSATAAQPTTVATTSFPTSVSTTTTMASSATSSTTSSTSISTSTTTIPTATTSSTSTIPTTTTTIQPATTVQPTTTVPWKANTTSAALTTGQLSAYSSCGATPQVIINRTAFLLHVPAEYSCNSSMSPDHSRLQSINPTTSPIVSYQFNARFVGVGNATTPYEYKDEEVVTLVNNIANYQGQEFGMHVAMNSGELFGYLQNGPGPTPITVLLKPGPGNAFNYSGRFKVTLQYVNGVNIIKYYLNGNKIGEIDYPSSQDYATYDYYVLLTTHRWENGWGSGPDTLAVSNFTITTS